MNNSTLPENQIIGEFGLLFNESIVPQGLIQIKPLDNESVQVDVVNTNKVFNEIANIKPLVKPKSAKSIFNFFDDFRTHSITQFYLTKTIEKAVFICKSGGETYKLHLKKLNNTSILFSLEDATEFYSISAELNKKKRQIKETQEIANIGYWFENHKSKSHYWSDHMYHILNETPKSISPSFSNYTNLVYKTDKSRVNDSFNDAINNKTGYEITHRLRLKNGTVKTVIQRCYTNYDYKGNPVQSVGIIQDITTSEIIKNELRNSEAIFKSVFNYAPLAIVLLNVNYDPLLCNTQFADIFGYTISQLLAKNLKDITHPDDYKSNIDQYRSLFNGEVSSFSTTKRYVHKDKTVRWAKLIVSAIKNSNGDVDTAIAMVQDISTEKYATEALSSSEYKYQTLIENADDGIGLFDLDFKPIVYNKMLYQMLGYNRDEYLGFNHNKYELFHTDDVQVASKAILSVKKGEHARIESRMRNKDGSYSYFSISYIPVTHEHKSAILIFRRNISKRKLAEQQNEEYRLFLETIMDNLPVSLFAKTTPDLRYLYWNKTIENVTGISADDAIGRTDFELLQFKKMADNYQAEDRNLLKYGVKLESEHETTNVLGETKQFKTIKILHKANTGNPLILGISMDITKLKEAEKQIEQSTDMLKEAQKIAKLGYWEYDVGKDLFFENPENREILGTEKLSYFINSYQFKELFYNEDKDTVSHAFKRCIVSKKTSSAIVRIKTEIGIKHIAINYRPIEDAKGKVVKLRGTCLDITHIRNSEIKLKKTTKQVLDVQKIAKIGFIELSKSVGEIKFSPTLMLILESNVSFKSIDEYNNIIYPEDKNTIIKTVNKSISKKQSYNIQYRLRLQNGKIKFVNEICEVNSETTLENYTRVIQDITAIKEQEIIIDKMLYEKTPKETGYRSQINEFSNSFELFDAVNENSFLGIVIYQDDKRVFANRKWSEMVGVDTASLSLGMDIDKIYKPESLQFLNKLFTDWKDFELTEYNNKITLHPIHAPKFTVVISMKEIMFSNKKSFLIIANPE